MINGFFKTLLYIAVGLAIGVLGAYALVWGLS